MSSSVLLVKSMMRPSPAMLDGRRIGMAYRWRRRKNCEFGRLESLSRTEMSGKTFGIPFGSSI